MLPTLVFENLNSLETLSLQNNKLSNIPEEVTENIVDTLHHIDITGNVSFLLSVTLTLTLLLTYDDPLNSLYPDRTVDYLAPKVHE